MNQCLVLDSSDMIVIDYPDVQIEEASNRRSMIEKCFGDDCDVRLTRYRIHSTDGLIDHLRPDELTMVHGNDYNKDGEHRLQAARTAACKRNSHASDTSSAYSGSDMMQSSVSGEVADLSGLTETLVDSDDEEGYVESSDGSTVRDNVQEIFEKSKNERTDDDIETLLENFKHLPAFANMTMAIRREMCRVMALAVVDKANMTVLEDGEILDSWSVILNGHVEVIKPDKTVLTYNMGESFGISASKEIQKHVGVMRTKVDNCQFICIDQENYYRILTQGEENTIRHEENNKVVLVTEQQVAGGSKKDFTVIRGTKDKLLDHLLEISNTDPSYVEDFLLTYRTFLSSPYELTSKLLAWFDDKRLRDRVTRIVLLWVNNHYNDFESESGMSEFLEKFENLLTQERMEGQLRLLNIACAAKARPRNVVVRRSDRNQVLQFHILGGQERGAPIFITNVQKNTKAHEAGLKRGDQILQVNNQSFDKITHKKALEILRGSTHLSMVVKSNLMAFTDLLQESTHVNLEGLSIESHETNRNETRPQRLSAPDLQALGVKSVLKSNSTDKEKKSFISGSKAMKIRKALMKLYWRPKAVTDKPEGRTLKRSLSSSGSIQLSTSNPDLSAFDDSEFRAFPDYVIKVYRSDQTFKYLPIQKETTAQQVVMLALKQFGMTEPSTKFSLCIVTIETEDVVKQKRLPDQLDNLAERSSLNGRYYLKENTETEPLIPDEQKGELLKEGLTSLLQLHPAEIAAQLTLNDFRLFNSIHPTEYIDDLFDKGSVFGTPNLMDFVKLVNKETLWVVTEILKETNLVRRVKFIKHFIKIARHCRELKNFNSVFAIVSGLDHTLLSKLNATWEKVSRKYTNLLEDLRQLFMPLRNFSNYRRLVNSERIEPPMIPFFPLFKKDLSFIHLGNDDFVEGLINFEKLRMLAREIRHISNMATIQNPMHTLFMHGLPTTGAHAERVFSAFGSRSLSAPSNAALAVATIRRKRKASTAPNLKKIYEEGQMVRKVRDYLEKLKVIEDDEELKELAQQCDSKEGSLRGLKRESSPSIQSRSTRNSATSLAPNAFADRLGPAEVVRKRSWTFGDNILKSDARGVTSLDSMNKLIGLRSKTKPHNNKHDPLPTSTVSPIVPRKSKSPPSPTTPPPPKLTLTMESSSVSSTANSPSKQPPPVPPRRYRERNSESCSSVNSEKKAGDRSHQAHGNYRIIVY
ncbi:DgyrCDS12420 [Dimorphilus gyrociliatus]|uniref:DgyrCDS12420 n=1 Tax=Dimorphilus gyrociliatus TaxID=2664684 RepID=A0A7I8W772_9ANNE|nr:DgyrCDS12420 [Dimorphilus gyrociliatus]